MHMFKGFGLAVAGIALAMAAPAEASIKTFYVTGYNTMVFSIDDSAAPDSWTLASFDYDDVDAIFNGIPMTGTVRFHMNNSGVGDGGFEAFGHGVIFEQLYSGPTDSPTFLLGTFAMRERNSVHFATLTISEAAAATPEPATWAMLIIGFGAIGASVRRRRREGQQKLI